MFNGIAVCAGMRRSASTWQYHIAREIVLASGGDVWGWVIHQELTRYINGWAGKPTVLKTHVYYPKHNKIIEPLLGSGSARVLYSYRDLRQVAASMSRLASMNGDKYKDMIRELEAVIESYEGWSHVPYILMQPYEKITGSPRDCIREIADLLEHPLSEQEINDLAYKYCPQEQIKRLPEEGLDEEMCLWAGHVSDGDYEGIDNELKARIESRFGGYLRMWGYME